MMPLFDNNLNKTSHVFNRADILFSAHDTFLE